MVQFSHPMSLFLLSPEEKQGTFVIQVQHDSNEQVFSRMVTCLCSVTHSQPSLADGMWTVKGQHPPVLFCPLPAPTWVPPAPSVCLTLALRHNN